MPQLHKEVRTSIQKEERLAVPQKVYQRSKVLDWQKEGHMRVCRLRSPLGTRSSFHEEDAENNGFTKQDMRDFDMWAKEPKAAPKQMPYKQRVARFGNQKWRLSQESAGGHDTIPTELYPEQSKENASTAPSRQSTWSYTPSSSSTRWNTSSWQASDWQSQQWRENQRKWPSAPWQKEENQWKRHKW